MTINGQWLIATIEQMVLVFLATFLPSLILAGAGAFSLSSLGAAAIAGGGAVVVFLQSLVASLVVPKQTNALTAFRTRYKAGAAPVAPAAA